MFRKLATTLQIICSKDYATMAPELYSSDSVRTAAERTKLALKKYLKAMQTEHNSGSYSTTGKVIHANKKKLIQFYIVLKQTEKTKQTYDG